MVAELSALAPDDPAAAELWHEASRISLEEGAVVVLAQKPSFVGLNRRSVG